MKGAGAVRGALLGGHGHDRRCLLPWSLPRSACPRGCLQSRASDCEKTGPGMLSVHDGANGADPGRHTVGHRGQVARTGAGTDGNGSWGGERRQLRSEVRVEANGQLRGHSKDTRDAGSLTAGVETVKDSQRVTRRW